MAREPQDEQARITLNVKDSSASSEQIHHECGWGLVKLLISSPIKEHFRPVLSSPQFEAALRDAPDTRRRRFDSRFMALHEVVQRFLEQNPLVHPELEQSMNDLFTTFGWMLDDGTIPVPSSSLSLAIEPW